MRAIALFLDGMSRGLIASFGPSLVNRLVYGGTLKLGIDCAKVALPLATLASAYLLGRGAGNALAVLIRIEEEKLPRTVARLAGAGISLLVFTFGAGLESVWWLFLIRFLSGFIVGILHVLTQEIHVPSENNITREEQKQSYVDIESGLCQIKPENNTASSYEKRKEYTDLTPGTARIYMTAFAVSILAGGLLYRHATGDATFRALTGSRQFTLSPLFLVGVSLIAESVLRCFFSFFQPKMILSQSTKMVDDCQEHVLSVPEHLKAGESPTRPQHRAFENDEASAFSGDRLLSGNSTDLQSTRGRLGTSDSEFFDCQSVLSGMEDLYDLDLEKNQEDTICRYVDGRCLDRNGAPSYVPNGDMPDTVPKNYLVLCGQNEKKAKEMWKKTIAWRRRNDVWRIHTIPNRFFHDIKKAYPHFIHGVSKQGFPIVYEQPGKMNLKQLFRDGCHVDDMLRHYMFFLEFISNHICTRPDVREKLGTHPPLHSSSTWGIMVVLDVKGAGISHLSGDVLTYLKGAGEINNAHYPLSLKRAFVVNSPFWLAGTFSSIKGLLPESVTVDIVSSHQSLRALHEYIDDDQIPECYGGSSPFRLGEHPFEVMLHDLVKDAAKGNPSIQTQDDCTGEDYLDSVEEDGDSSFTRSVSPWKPEMNPNAGPQTRRRRQDQGPYPPLPGSDDILTTADENDKKKGGYVHSPTGVNSFWVIVSALFALWSGVQGLIEIAVPLWILTPPELGGLGYAPSRSGVAMFSSAMVLLWVLRTKASTALSQIPCKAPMRSFRIGVGAQSVLLFLLATVPRTVQPAKRSDAVVIMALTIILMSCIVLSSILGRASSTILHRTASAGMFRQGGTDKFIENCKSGKFTYQLNFVAETCGALSVAPFGAWSLQNGRVAPFDGTCCLLLASLVALGLYVSSFSLDLNFDGEFESRADKDSGRRRSFLCEVVSVSVNDVASLFDERSLNPLLGSRHADWEIDNK